MDDIAIYQKEYHQLTYNIVSRHLAGRIGDNVINTLVNYIAQKGGAEFRQGYYTLHLHEIKPGWIRLLPEGQSIPRHFPGFAIHRLGDQGNDSSLIPNDIAVVQRLVKIVKEEQEKGDAPIVLKVVSMGQTDQFNNI